MDTIYCRIAEARRELNLTQREAASSSGLSLRAYSRYESGEGGREIPSSVLGFYAQNGVNVNWILTGHGAIYQDIKLSRSEEGLFSVELHIFIPLSRICVLWKWVHCVPYGIRT